MPGFPPRIKRLGVYLTHEFLSCNIQLNVILDTQKDIQASDIMEVLKILINLSFYAKNVPSMHLNWIQMCGELTFNLTVDRLQTLRCIQLYLR